MGSCFCTSAHLTPHINMKFLVLSVVLSAATAAPSFFGLVGHPNGAVVPVDEPAVAARRAEHLGALASTHGAAYGAVPAVAAAPADEPAVAAARADHFAAGGGRVHAAPVVAAP